MPPSPPSQSRSSPSTEWFSALACRARRLTPSGRADFERLSIAAKEGDEAEVRRLLPRVGARGWGPAGNSPLAWAAGGGHAGCVEALIPESDLREGNEDGGSPPLLLAAFSGNRRCVELLLPHGDARRADSRGIDPLMAAVDSGPESAECVRLLLPHSDPRARDNEGLTALARAARLGAADCLAALLPHSDPAAVDKRGQTPLMHAVKAMSVECARLLLPVSDPHFKDANGWSAHEIAKNDFSSKSPIILGLIEGRELAEREAREMELEASPATAGSPAPKRGGARL